MAKKVKEDPVAGFLAKLKEITDKDISSLTKADMIFLQARSAYLSGKQKQVYAKFLKARVEPDVRKPGKKEIPYKKLQKQAKALGYPYVGISRADLEVSISTGVGPQDA